MMKEFGNHIICIDSTYKTTGYDFILVTVLVIDEFGEGYPTAWCLTTREDQQIVTLFFEVIRGKTGMLSPCWVMCDDADQFFNVGNRFLMIHHINFCAPGMLTEPGEEL